MKSQLRLYFKKKKHAMALALSLIVLLVAGMLVGVSMYIVQNMVETTKMKTENERRLNTALAGLEFGKQQIVDSVLSGFLPTRSGGLHVSASDLAADSVHFSTLVAHSETNTPFIFDETDIALGDAEMKVSVYVYDLAYTNDNDSVLTFSPGLPPSMWKALFSSGIMNNAGDYDAVNPTDDGLRTDYGGLFYDILRYYLVRSTATSPDGLSITVEQSVVVQK